MKLCVMPNRHAAVNDDAIGKSAPNGNRALWTDNNPLS
jgi:hypothetical protein